MSDPASSVPPRPPTAAELNAVRAAVRAGNTALAVQLAGRAAAQGAEHAEILMLAVHEALGRRAATEALAYALRARALAPHDPEVLNAYALALVDNGRPKEALAVYDAALRKAPARPGLHYNKGCAFEALNDAVHARIGFERALALQPANVEVLARLAFLAATAGDTDAARSYGERALRLKPGEPTASLALAAADLQAKHAEGALGRVAPLLRGPAGTNRSIAEGLAGDAFDALGRRDEAFRSYAASSATRRALFRPRYEVPGVESARAQAERLAAWFRASPPWPRETAAEPAYTHVFLVGFPRSGTTLLEQALAAHSEVESMEERPCLVDAANELLASDADLERLAALSGEALTPWREAYWTRAAEWGMAPSRKVFVDKLPLNSVCLGLIAKLFPRAKILFALRDPADVVWSCFRRRFGMSLQMYEFLTLEGAARYYDAVMTLAALYRDKLALDLHELRYEALVEDFAGETRRLCAFLGLEWTEALAGFATRARSVDTPSSAQLARGLYKTAVGQWTDYRRQLEPVLPVVAPWRARFGYA